MERRLNLLTFLYFLTITERGVALSTSTATAYEYNVAGHLSFGAPKCEKAQKSSGFWANRTYRLCIKDNVLIEYAAPGDFVFLDPPYVPVSEYADFKRYTKEQFYVEDHRNLAEEVKRLHELGCYVILTNSDHPLDIFL